MQEFSLPPLIPEGQYSLESKVSFPVHSIGSVSPQGGIYNSRGHLGAGSQDKMWKKGKGP